MAALALSGGVRMTGIVASTPGGRLAVTSLRSGALPLTVSRFPTVHRGGRLRALAEDSTDTTNEILDAADVHSTQEPSTSTRASHNDAADSRSAPPVKASTLMQRELKKEGKRRAVRMRPHSGARGRHSVGHVRRERRASASGGNEGEQAIDSDSERMRFSASNSSSSSNTRTGKASAKAGYSQGKVDPLDLLVTVLLVKNKGQTMDVGVILDSERISTRQLTTIFTKLRARNAPATVMLRVLDWAKQSKWCTLNVIHYNAVLAGLARRDWLRSMQVYHDMVEGGVEPDVYTFNTLINACAQRGDAERACDVFDEMKRMGVAADVFTYNTMILAFEQAGNWHAAIKMCETMREDGVLPDVVTYSTVINACENARELDAALKVYEDMRLAGVPPNDYTFRSLISVCQKSSDSERAWALFDQMRRLQITPTISTYSALIAACGQAKDVYRAHSILEEMKTDGLQPTVSVYNSLIVACVHSGEWAAALRMYEEMKPAVRPDIATATAVIRACKKGMESVPWTERADRVRQMAQQATADEVAGEVASLDCRHISREWDDDGIDDIVADLLGVATQIGQWPVDFLPPRR